VGHRRQQGAEADPAQQGGKGVGHDDGRGDGYEEGPVREESGVADDGGQRDTEEGHFGQDQRGGWGRGQVV